MPQKAAPPSRHNCASVWTRRYVFSRIPFLSNPFLRPLLTTLFFPQKSQDKKKNTVNYHLMRMYPKVVGPRKKDGVLG